MSQNVIKNLNLQYQTAIESLVADGSVPTAAAAAGVHPRTIYRWLSDSSFVEELRAAQKNRQAAFAMRLSCQLDKVADVLVDGLDARHPQNARLRAAQLIMEGMGTSIEVEPTAGGTYLYMDETGRKEFRHRAGILPGYIPKSAKRKNVPKGG